MAPLRIRRGDNVRVIGGKDAGKTGKVLRTEPKKRRIYVEGLNLVKRHQRPRTLKDVQRASGRQQIGGVIEKEGPIHISNVMLIDPKEGEPTKVRVERGGDGRRVRVTKRFGTRIEE